MRISIEVGEHKEGITALFIDFLAIYYNENELVSKKEGFAKKIKLCKSNFEKMQFHYEIQAIDRALELKRTDYAYLESNDISEIIGSYLK